VDAICDQELNANRYELIKFKSFLYLSLLPFSLLGDNRVAYLNDSLTISTVFAEGYAYVEPGVRQNISEDDYS
jgi:hypothetical protein